MTNADTVTHRLIKDLNLGSRAHAIFDDLNRRYAEPHRHYHTLTHLNAIFAMLETVNHQHADRPAIHLATWFHDAVYHPKRKDNEAQSAQLARTSLTSLGVDSVLIDKVCTMIEATATHQAYDDPGTALFLDLDMAILGSPSLVYTGYVRDVRKEYSHVPDLLFRQARRRLLKAWLKQSRIFQTEELHHRLETRARDNLRAELAGK